VGIRFRGIAAPPPPQHTLGNFFNRQSETEMVTPVPINMDKASPQPLIAKTELLDNTQTWGVFGPNTDLDAMQTQLKETKICGHRNRRRGESLAGKPLRNPVPN
jgi:hypothetical protein